MLSGNIREVISSLEKPSNTYSLSSFSINLKTLYMYMKVSKMMIFGTQTLNIHVWMICAKE